MFFDVVVENSVYHPPGNSDIVRIAYIYYNKILHPSSLWLLYRIDGSLEESFPPPFETGIRIVALHETLPYLKVKTRKIKERVSLKKKIKHEKKILRLSSRARFRRAT